MEYTWKLEVVCTDKGVRSGEIVNSISVSSKPAELEKALVMVIVWEEAEQEREVGRLETPAHLRLDNRVISEGTTTTSNPP